ncbi:MAG: hypothetical protein AAFP28_08770 [Pseudomonadota bacterium]
MYDRLKPLESNSGRETTAVTKDTVAQLMAREGAFEGLTIRAQQVPQHLFKRAQTPAEAPAEVKAAPALKQPPHMRGPVAVTVVTAPKVQAPAPVEEPVVEEPAVEEQEEAQPFEALAPAEGEKAKRGLLGRLFRG